MALGEVSDFYGPQDSFARLSNNQANQSVGVGYEAARMSDPFAAQRGQYQTSLNKLMSDPGSMTTSPFYQHAMTQGLNALQRKGTVRSGNKMAELMKYGQGIASQTFFPQANLLASLSGATTGSPAAAGLALSGAYNRSQDQQQQAAATKAFKPAGGGAQQQYDPFSGPGYDKPAAAAPAPRSGGGGYSGGGYYNPTSAAGTGTVTSEFGQYNFGGPQSGDSYYTPFEQGGYDPYGYSSGASDYYGGGDAYGGYDYGGYDAGGYSDYGGGADYSSDYYGEEY